MNFNGKQRVLSGSALKLIAMVAMVIDHVAYIFLYQKPEYSSSYELMRMVGRISFPVFAFLIVEGYFHTRNFGQYAKRLLVFAIFTEIPWQLLNHDGSHNVLFTLLAGLFVLYLVEHWKGKSTDIISLVIATGAILSYFHTDYDWRGLLLIVLFYLFWEQPVFQAILGIPIMSFYGLAGTLLAFLTLNTYNGCRGFIHGQFGQYLIYLFYPGHLMVLWIIKAYIIN